ncbi:DUF2164 domain-containing protein [Patescibacteria group bacterium]|nr:DUF2164 domain-containing protein [Patescibacteria group bacterium]
MKDVKRKWDLITKEKRVSSIKEIILYFKTKRDENIGVIAGEDLLDFFLQLISEDIYNKGVRDSQALLKRRLEDLDIDLELLFIR